MVRARRRMSEVQIGGGASRSAAVRSLRAAALAVAALGLCLCCALGPPPAPPQIDGPPIEIVPPAQPLALAALVTPGAFTRSRVNPQGVRVRFADVLAESRVFSKVLDAAPSAGPAALELEVSGADFGEPDAYSLELTVTALRERRFITSYSTKQSIRQPAGSRRQLTIGPPELGQLAERAIRDLIRQLAADSARYAAP
jgi:hypothetical protein